MFLSSQLLRSANKPPRIINTTLFSNFLSNAHSPSPSTRRATANFSSNSNFSTVSSSNSILLNDMPENSRLIEALYALAKKSPKLVKASNYQAPADKNITVTSWKMNEFKYYDVPSPFPTLARGLFTTENGDDTEGTDIKYRIVARGYDKFFNIGEVPWTNWRAIERHTVAPYTLTLKSNGCIIFIAALSPEKLLITSKHSIGPVAGVDESHAQVGERWLLKHLEKVGKTPEQLSQTLWDKRWTAIAELCDDSFEEHVLPIPTDMTGLHLHGLNANAKDFNTQAQPVVDAFAEEWGFIKTASLVLQTEREVREFTQEVGKTGKWNDVALEGFVVRTTIGPRPTDEQRDTPPYQPGSSFFFKVKFDEPYMMYRDWREMTKALLTAKAKGKMSEARISKAKLRRKETVVYKHWVEREIVQNPKAFANYTKGRGIIAVRNNFFKWLETPEGKEKASRVDIEVPPQDDVEAAAEKSRKVVIVPIAVPGCGKTTIAVALKHLFGFGHTQSDDIKTKKSAPAFHNNIAELLKIYDVVIADRNNHLNQHRAGIREAVSKFKPPPRLIALDWAITNAAPATVHRIVTDRIVSRGENHQSLTPEHVLDYEDVVWRFLKDSNELAEGEVDDVIEMEIDESLEDALSRAVNGVIDLLGESHGLEKPTDEEMGEALRIAHEYSPTLKTKAKKVVREGAQKEKAEQSQPSKKKSKAPPTPRYYGILPEIELATIVDGAMTSDELIPDSGRIFWEHLKKKSRIAGRPHITVTHSKSRESEGDVWDACEKLIERSTQGTQPFFQFDMGHLVWNERVMTLTVENLRVAEGGGEEAATEFLSKLPEDVKLRFHITVGTKEPSIPPVEARDLVQAWRSSTTTTDNADTTDDTTTTTSEKGKEKETTAGSGGKVEAIDLKGVTAQGRLKGLMS